MDGRWVLLTLAVGAVAAVGWRRRALSDANGPQDRPSPRPSWTTDDFSADDVDDAELDEALNRIWAEHASAADALLDARVRQLVLRGVPARAIRRAPGGRSVRVIFADGTVLLCRGTGQGDFGRLGLALLKHSVWLSGYTHEADGTRLEFRWKPDQRLAAVAVGLDQPD
jgi:hypothetical protein